MSTFIRWFARAPGQFVVSSQTTRCTFVGIDCVLGLNLHSFYIILAIAVRKNYSFMQLA